MTSAVRLFHSTSHATFSYKLFRSTISRAAAAAEAVLATSRGGRLHGGDGGSSGSSSGGSRNSSNSNSVALAVGVGAGVVAVVLVLVEP